MSRRVAVLFAGHAVRRGMARAWTSWSSGARALARRADAALGYPLVRLMDEGPEAELAGTRHAQPASVLAALLGLEALRELGVEPAFLAGRSVGDFAALCAAGCLSLEDTLRLVAGRGEDFAAACAARRGAMAAFDGLDRAGAEALAAAAAAETGLVCVLAGVNSPRRTIVSGDAAAVAAACRAAAARGAHVLELKVSGAFHSVLVEPARRGLARRLAGVALAEPDRPVATGLEGRVGLSAAQLRAAVVRQVTAPVLWKDTTRALAAAGADLLVEVGPGQGLAQAAVETVPGVPVCHVFDEESARAFAASLGAPSAAGSAA